MFFKKKVKSIIHPLLGELKTGFRFEGEMNIDFWGRTTECDIYIYTDKDQKALNDMQEKSVAEFFANMPSYLNRVEAAFEQYFNISDKTELIKRFEPIYILVNTIGELGIEFVDNELDTENLIDDMDYNIGVAIIPEVKVWNTDKDGSYEQYMALS